MREDIRHHNLTFTEIAKLVGENWQTLPPAEKEVFESQANIAKEKYHRDLAEYKKTPEYRQYAQYLQEFKERQAKAERSGLSPTCWRPTYDQPKLTLHIDPKRTKLEPARLRHGSSSSSSAAHGSGSGGGSMRGSRSSSERMQGSEPPPARQERLNSIGSNGESLPGMSLHKHHMSVDEPRHSPRSDHFEFRAQNQQQQSLPSLSDVFDEGRVGGIHIGPCADEPHYNGYSPAHRRPLVDGPPGRAPLLRHQGSSSGSLGSGSTASSMSRPTMDGPLPIHALLSNQGPPPPYEASNSPTFINAPSPIDAKTPLSMGQPHVLRGYGEFTPSAWQPSVDVDWISGRLTRA